MGQLVAGVFAEAQVLGADAVAHVPVEPVFHPLLQPFLVGTRLDEELNLHLLELAGAEGEVAGRDFIAKGFADLGDAEGQLFAGGGLNVLEVDEDALGGFRAQEHFCAGILNGAHEGAEHEVEPAWLGELAAVFGTNLGFQLVLAEPAIALAALHQRVAEVFHVAAGFPDAGVHQDGGVEAHHVVALGHDGTPPGFLDVALEFHAERAIVPGRSQSAVHLAGLKDETPSLGQGEDFIHIGVGEGARHKGSSQGQLTWIPAFAGMTGTWE